MKPRSSARAWAADNISPPPAKTITGCRNIGRYRVPSASSYGSPISSARVPARPLTRNAVTLRRCQPARSSRSSTAILVSKRIRPLSGRYPPLVLYVVDVLTAWRPAVPGVTEVFHAHFVDHVYPLHLALADPADAFEAESRLALIRERLRGHLHRRPPGPVPHPTGLARELRELLDARTVEGLSLREAADLLHAHPTHLVRAFTRAHGLPPHRYLTGRRIDRARRLLLSGRRPAPVAAGAGV